MTEEEKLEKWIKEAKFPKKIKIKGNEYKILNRGNNSYIKGIPNGKRGFVLQVENEYGAKKAIKCSTIEAYSDRSPINEVKLTSKLGDIGLFVIPEAMEKIEINNKYFYCFVQQWINGETLGHIIRHKEHDLQSEFIRTILLEILQAITILSRRKLQHYDLHINNIMLENPSEDLTVGGITPPKKVKIVDTGCIMETNEESPERYIKDDFYYFISTVVDLRNTLFNNRKLYVNSIDFVSMLDDFIVKLNDEDSARTWDNTDSTDKDIFDVITRELKSISTDNKFYEQNDNKLTQPFEAMSVEFFSSNKLIIDLFVENNYWYKTVASKEPTIFTGPRGCGKSMVFKYLAIDTHLQDKNSTTDILKTIPFLGIYISCSRDLQGYLYWIKNRIKDDKQDNYQYYHDGIITFFSLLLCSKLVFVLHRISLNKNASKHYHSSKNKIDNIIAFTMKRMHIKDNKVFVLSGISKLLSLHNILNRFKSEIHLALLRKEINKETDLPLRLDESFIFDISEFYYKELGESNPVTFLMDDYTDGRVPKEVQKILNIIIWQRTHFQHFKVSSEKLSISRLNSYGVTADMNREYTEIDTGNFALSDSSSKEFITKILDHRFNSAGWKGRVNTLIGNSEFSTNEALRNEIKRVSSLGPSGRYYYYYGIEIIANLWTGDTATILQMVKKITMGANKETVLIIGKKEQHESIENISKIYERHIENFHPYGIELKAISEAFGGYMYERLKQDNKNIPRIEFSLSNGEDIWVLLKNTNEKSYNIARELIKRTIFIDMNEGKAKEKDRINTIRWQFKRIYYPAHKVSYGKDDYLDIKNINEFSEFLTNPKSYLNTKLKNNKQEELFDE